ncbi:uncharacterized protein LOC144642792 [Oculina patagonica]
MFRLLFVLILVFILRSFASTQNKSTKKVSANGTQQNQCGKTSLKECCYCRDGRDGRDGKDGKDGRDGRDGGNGLKGEKGKPGILQENGGINGTKGQRGEQGLSGNDGINGTKGEKGQQGLRGNDGINGTKGEKGEQGLTGNDGINGTKGQKGEQGLNGNDVINGSKGQKGQQGLRGNDGINGTKGDMGEQGLTGNDGINGTKGVKGEQGIRGGDGINGTKGQKGERGLPGKSLQGAIKFSDIAENCSLHTAGTVRYNTSQKTLQLCNGHTWLPLVTAWKGHVASNPGRHCLDILNSGQSRGSGLYWIDPNGGSTDHSFQAFCDMENERGGWTLVATKVSPTFLFIKTEFSSMAAKTRYADAASHIHPDMGDWEEVMFRFADVNTIRVIYNRMAGAPQNDKTEFEKFLMGKFSSIHRNVDGFYKYSPADKNQRSPTQGFATISNLALYSKQGISETHGGTDKWLDMWHHVDRAGNNYVTVDDSRALGTKCIAGYCYLNKPIWVMVR